MFASNGAHGQSAPALPELLNTGESDRLLRREVGDGYIHQAEPVTRIGTGTPAATVLAEAPLPDDIWDRLRSARNLQIPLEQTLVQHYLQEYQHEARAVSRILHRGRWYLAHFVQALEQRSVPIELALLPAIESGFEPGAVSPVHAAGLWQILPGTADDIGVTRDSWFDGRVDVVQSTRAAIEYLNYLNAEFNGDWLLTLAAYNGGPARIKRAMAGAIKEGRSGDFWSLRLPHETRHYVPRLLALVQLLRDAPEESLALSPLSLHPAFTPVDLDFRISLARAAKLAGVPERDLQRLNPGLTHAVTAPQGPHRLYLPTDTVSRFTMALQGADSTELLDDYQYEVRPGDTLSELAQRYGVSQQQLIEMNDLDDSILRIGQRLDIIDLQGVAHTTVNYEVVSGDTLWDIAERFGVQSRSITRADGHPLQPSTLRPGQQLSIPVPLMKRI